MIQNLKRIFNKIICLHEYERIDSKKTRNLSPDELIILQCKKCKKIKFVGGYTRWT